MRSYVHLLAILFGVFCIASSTPAKDMKVGYIESSVIFSKYKGTAEAQSKYNEEVAKWEQEAEVKQKKIKELNDQLESQGLLMSEAKKNQLKEDIKRLYVEYQGYVNKVFGNQGDAYKKNEEYTKPIITKINQILNEIGKNEGYDFIFDATVGGVVYAKDAYNLTDRIIKELNKGL